MMISAATFINSRYSVVSGSKGGRAVWACGDRGERFALVSPFGVVWVIAGLIFDATCSPGSGSEHAAKGCCHTENRTSRSSKSSEAVQIQARNLRKITGIEGQFFFTNNIARS